VVWAVPCIVQQASRLHHENNGGYPLFSWYRRLACMVRSYQPEVLTGKVFCQFKARPKAVSVDVLLVGLLAL
jgi:hypothetical protein